MSIQRRAASARKRKSDFRKTPLKKLKSDDSNVDLSCVNSSVGDLFGCGETNDVSMVDTLTSSLVMNEAVPKSDWIENSFMPDHLNSMDASQIGRLRHSTASLATATQGRHKLGCTNRSRILPDGHAPLRTPNKKQVADNNPGSAIHYLSPVSTQHGELQTSYTEVDDTPNDNIFTSLHCSTPDAEARVQTSFDTYSPEPHVRLALEESFNQSDVVTACDTSANQKPPSCSRDASVVSAGIAKQLVSVNEVGTARTVTSCSKIESAPNRELTTGHCSKEMVGDTELRSRNVCNVASKDFNPSDRLGGAAIPGDVSLDNEIKLGAQRPKTSISDRVRKSLQQNAKAATPQLSKKKIVEARMVEQALKEASQIRKTGTGFDVGPFYGLPTKVQELFQSNRGISKLYDWQDECLRLPAVTAGQNLIYSLPTSGGKTLVAEILILREMLCKQKDALLILPYVAIVQEKVRGLSAFALELDFLVEEYASSKGQIPPRKRRNKKSLYIGTIEKANSLVNSLIETQRLHDIGLVVVDELHMLGEGSSRGAILEMTLTKVIHINPSTQIVGMSATLNNLGDLKSFLQADVFSSDFRPVELREFVKMDENLYEINANALCPEDRLKHSRVVTFEKITYDAECKKKDPDHLAGLVMEVIPQNSCLVFCPTKKNCENVAELLCKLLPRETTNVKKDKRKELLKALLHDGNGNVCPVLRKTIWYGIAYHHSGLTMDERKLLEEAYLEGTLCLLACTSTLAAGVNLPAKRVILRSPYVGKTFLSRSRYKQMVGRAGRAGLDSSGESILILPAKDKLKLAELVGGPYDYCRSSLLYEKNKGLKKLLLTTVGLKIMPTTTAVLEFLKKTLCHTQSTELGTDIVEMARTALQELLDSDLVTQKRSNSQSDDAPIESRLLEVTKLGRAVFKGSVDIDYGAKLYKDLCQAQESLVISSYLHLLYLVTPYDMVGQVKPSWMVYLDELSCLDPGELNVASLIGVKESYVTMKVSGQRIRKKVDEFAVDRFYLTLILYNLWKQRGLWEVSAKFQLPRGFIQQLLNGAASFAFCVSHFCQELEEFWAYHDLLGGFVKQLSYCVTMELIPLMEIPGVKIGRARQFYNAGYRTLQQVAHANPADLVQAIEHMPRRTAGQIVSSAKMLMSEKAESLREDAEDMVAFPGDMPSVKQSDQRPAIYLDLSPVSTISLGTTQSSQARSQTEPSQDSIISLL